MSKLHTSDCIALTGKQNPFWFTGQYRGNDRERPRCALAVRKPTWRTSMAMSAKQTRVRNSHE